MTGVAQDTRLERVVFDQAAPRSGPTLIIVGALHANEPAGLAAAERINTMLNEQGGPERGRIVALRGNLAALEAKADKPWLRPRYLDTDLNRLFTGPDDAAAGKPRELRERDDLCATLARLVHESRGKCYLIDMHTVSSDSPAFVAFEDSLPARRFVMNFPLPKIVGIEEELTGLLMDYATSTHGCISCIIEAGRHDDPRSAAVHEAAVLLAAKALGLILLGTKTAAGEAPIEVVRNAAQGRGASVYDVRHRAVVAESSFKIRDHARAFMPIKAHRTVIADESTTQLMPERSGLLFMPNRQQHVRAGDDAYFVVTRIGTVWLALSSFLRTRKSIRWMIVRCVPGVRQRAGHPGELLVSPDITPLLRREILHLLGYRVIRHRDVPYRPLPFRFAYTSRATITALVRIFCGLFRPSLRRVHDEHEYDWIVRRHVLDHLHD